MGIAYANMRSLFGHTNYYMLQETTSDELVMPANPSGWDDGGVFKRMHLHTWNSENPQLANMWNAMYQGSNQYQPDYRTTSIRQNTSTNRSHQGIAGCGDATARAFFYWLICDNFGDAPLVTTTGYRPS